MEGKLFARIAPLFDIGVMATARVFIAGCGSGGGSVALQLAMSGIVDFALADHEALEPENVIRHVCGLRYVGQRKVDALADVLRDRNPKINVTTLDTDLLRYDGLDDEVASSTVVVLATDNEPSRYRINESCVKTGTPFVVGRVFTRGIGGEVFAFRPGSGGGTSSNQTIGTASWRTLAVESSAAAVAMETPVTTAVATPGLPRANSSRHRFPEDCRP